MLHSPIVEKPGERAPPGHLTTEKDVGRDVKIVGESEVLVDGLDAERFGIPRLLDFHPSSVEGDRACVLEHRARERLDKRRLAGRVVADQGMHLAKIDIEIDILQRLHAAITFGDAAHLDERIRALSHYPAV